MSQERQKNTAVSNQVGCLLVHFVYKTKEYHLKEGIKMNTLHWVILEKYKSGNPVNDYEIKSSLKVWQLDTELISSNKR